MYFPLLSNFVDLFCYTFVLFLFSILWAVLIDLPSVLNSIVLVICSSSCIPALLTLI